MKNIIEKIKDNKKEITLVVVGILVGVIVTSLLTPKKIAKLSNGEEVVAEVNGSTFTANQLYDELKSDSGGISALINLVDNYILHQEFPDKESEAEEYASSQSEYILSMYESYYGYTEDEFLEYAGFSSSDSFIEYLQEEYYYQLQYDAYVESTITEDEINEYYEDSVFGTKSIYMFSSTDDTEILEKVRKYLKKGKTYDEITEKYDDVVANSYDSVTYTDTTLTDTILEKIADMNAGEYSEVFTDSTYGNVVVYVVSSEDKPTLEDERENIIDVLVDEKQSEDSDLYYKALIKLRSDYGLTIYDSNLNDSYDDYIESYE